MQDVRCTVIMNKRRGEKVLEAKTETVYVSLTPTDRGREGGA